MMTCLFSHHIASLCQYDLSLLMCFWFVAGYKCFKTFELLIEINPISDYFAIPKFSTNHRSCLEATHSTEITFICANSASCWASDAYSSENKCIDPETNGRHLAHDSFKRKESISKMPVHYNDVIMIAMVSQITSLTVVYSTAYLGTDEKKHQSSA